MTCSTPMTSKSSWTQIQPTLVLDGDNKYESCLVYSPDDLFGLRVCYLTKSFTCRLSEMATGEMLDYKFDTQEFAYDIKPIVYFVNPREFVVVTLDERVGCYDQLMYTIDTKHKEIRRIYYKYFAAAAYPTSRLRLNRIRGCSALEVKGKKFLVLPADEGLLLTAWNPVNTDRSCIKIVLPLNERKFKDYYFYNNMDHYHCYGSKIFFKACKGTSLFQSRENGEDLEVMREYYDRFLVLDFAKMDLTKRAIIINQDSDKLDIVNLTKTTDGGFNEIKEYLWSQDGKYLIASEIRKFNQFTKKRPATKKKVYIIDLENRTTSIVLTRTRSNCVITVYNESLLIMRTVERRCKKQRPGQKCENLEITYQFKTLTIPNGKVPSLLSLTKNYFMLGRSGITLPDTYITRFFES